MHSYGRKKEQKKEMYALKTLNARRPVYHLLRMGPFINI